MTVRLLCVLDRQVQLERGDTAAQELVNSLQVLEVMAGAMASELKPLVRLTHQDSYHHSFRLSENLRKFTFQSCPKAFRMVIDIL